MDYDPKNQYRCTIIRGKTITRMDDLLPFYAETLEEICPIDESLYDDTFDQLLMDKLPISEKAISNHRTENVESILGMVLKHRGKVYLSERTKQFLEDDDQPLFFKSVCFNFQQPNAAQSITTIKEDLENDIAFKPYHYVIALLKAADNVGIELSKKEIGYFCLNNLDVMQGKVATSDVIRSIIEYREQNKSFEIGRPDKKRSYNWQHIKEQFDYLKFANLIRENGEKVVLNRNEKEVINYFINDLSNPLHFKIYSYDVTSKEQRKQMSIDWNYYYGSLDHIDLKAFATSLKALSIPTSPEDTKTTHEIGNEGEEFVLEYEKQLVKEFHPRLVNKVKHQGTSKGLGYDILSIEASRDKTDPEFARYIEVKSTKRTTKPDLEQYWDRVNFTRNEWVAATQQEDRFFIYRVYFTSEGVYLAIIKNPVEKNEEKKLYAAPTNYRIEFNDDAIDDLIFSEKEEI